MTGPGTNSGRRASWQLKLAVARQDGDVWITATGRLGAASAPELMGTLAEAIAGDSHRIVLDLKELDYISSAGVMALETAAARLRTEGRELVLSSPTPPVRLALVLAGFPDDVRVVGRR